MANIKDIKSKMPKKEILEKVRPEDELSEEELMEYEMLPSQKPQRDMSSEAIKRRAEEFQAQQERDYGVKFPEEPGLKDDDITEMFIPMGGTVKGVGKGLDLGGKAVSKAGIEAAEKAVAKMAPEEKAMFMKWWKYLTPAEKMGYKADDAASRTITKGLKTEAVKTEAGDAAAKAVQMKAADAKKALNTK